MRRVGLYDRWRAFSPHQQVAQREVGGFGKVGTDGLKGWGINNHRAPEPSDARAFIPILLSLRAKKSGV